MIKQYIIPAEGDGPTQATGFRPKYLEELRINWSGVHISDKNVFLVTVNTKDSEKISKLLALQGVLDVSTSDANTKSAVKTLLKTKTIPETADVIDFIGKLQDLQFNKRKMWVESD